jgi:hypothetical protein
MPTLKPHRRELFARNVIKAAQTGKSATWAYEQSGYTTTGNASEAAASRLLSDVKVQARISEIGRPAVQRTRVSVESLLNELETTISDARSENQHSVVIQALTLSAKLVGLLKEKVEIEHSYGNSRAEILDQLEQRHGREAIDVLRAALDNTDYTKPLITKAITIDAPSAGRSEADIVLEERRREK